MTDDSAVEMWVSALHELAKPLEIAEVEAWLLPLDPEFRNGAFCLIAPFSVFAARVEKIYGTRIRAALGRDVRFVFRNASCPTEYDSGWRRVFLASCKAPLGKERYTIKLLPREEDFAAPSEGEQDSLLKRGEETIDAIIGAVAKVFGVVPDELIAQGRKRRVAVPRHMAVYLSRTRTSASYPQLGHAFGDRNHTSIMRSFDSAKALLEQEPVLRGKLELVRRLLAAGA